MHIAAFGGMTQVRFVVVTPDASDAQPLEIHCTMSIDGWPERGRALKRMAPNIYTAVGPLRAGTRVEYKFLREPSWLTVEKGGNGEELPNRTLEIKSDVGEQVVLQYVARWADRPRPSHTAVEFNRPGEGALTIRRSTLTGDIRVHHLFHAPQLKNARTIMVYLPPGYDDSPEARYPVLYMHDGDNLFDAKTSFAGIEWGVDETAQRLIEHGRMRAAVIVGIHNTPQRDKEYTPFKDARHGGGSGEAYVAFLVETLKPFIDKTYRTLPDREQTGIAGSSLGGLISLYALFSHPEVFGFAGVMSPALWWAKRRIVSFVRAADTPRPIKLWLDIGTLESEPVGPLADFTGAVEDCRQLVKVLHAKGYEDERDVHYEEIEGGRHHELDWAARVDRMLLYLFGSAVVDETEPATEPVAPARRGSRR